MKSLFPDNVGLVGKVLDLHLERQNVVMSNLANIDIPAYKARKMDFEGELQKALDRDGKGRMTRTESGHIPSAFDASNFEGELSEKWKPQVVAGLDAVDMDKEMAVMAKNTLMYNALSDIARRSFEGIQKVIAEGGK
ncbi:flagellar basal body rod protein FlgB [Desulfovibrio sulfodismutans]|uniref:Flagellar basal body rod protein FlgB n=1 Tax=Desulfolutivibrio sulfodismutans TaxID=63561 RepID=A0A7K3NHV3_9BACT|nr:flagellar basal body rod protein FlgB [Desulfolutivibrio sulfodismutans]NDY55776.1 flagellar basal body rod protein FlgB [Desulfolutivibrio sulfodismutans]QLA13393.1 flagellar basal body rod protein FlgB [Desulfolutivibrio sulfodismutans DSM 3696]